MKEFTNKQNKILTEVYRRLNYLNKGNLNEPLLHLAFPSEIKEIKGFGILTPYDEKEKPKILNWYRLTEKGKTFFSNYVTKNKLSEETNHRIFTGEYVKSFDINLLK